ncbi:MAG: acetolactate synthase large subunit, partial [Clostridiales bacterium]|nr:acetolactate synthase large subunit [Clostridiales bacterium]
MEMTGAKLLVKALIMEKVDMIFAYPGGQIIDVFDALYEKKEIEVILPRHEQGLIHAADGYARSTKKVGVCLVTSGPGATNLVTGIATAQYDSVPLVCFTGQVPQNLQGKDAFQEVNIVEITKSICKLAISVNNREDLGGAIQKAFFIAKNGRPGVVVVDLPKDIQRALGSSSYMASQVKMFPKNHTDRSKLLLIKAMDIIHKSKRPLFLLGGGIGMSKASKEIVELIKTLEIPVVTTIMGKGAIPTRHPLYLGNLGIHGSVCANMAVSECDVLIAIGTRFNDRITGKTEKFKENKILIHIDIDPGSLSKNIQADIGILGDAKVVISEMQKQARHLFLPEWMEQINQWKQNYPMTMVSQEMTPLDIIQEINHYFKDVIVVTDVGQNQLWTTQFLELDEN